jgi:type I restriction enzyme M protein
MSITHVKQPGGRAYEYLIKMFADDAGAKAGEFFTPPEVVDILIRILEPHPGDTVYDPTCGSGGMLVHSADFLQEQGHSPDQIRYYGQEMNWQTYAIARINTILHGLEADIRGGKSTITDPQFTTGAGVSQFSMVIANFPFSDEFWWLPSEQQGEEQAKKARKQFAKEGYTDKFNRFTYGKPPASTGDWAFIQHIIASMTTDGRAGVVCPQGVLFRGQPEIEEETGEFDADGNPKIRRRKADDEYLIRKGLLDARLIDAVIALPLNIFYGAGVPACLLILNKNRPARRRDKVLLVYAARHYRELSAMNQLRPQDVMRILVHYHAYGDAKAAAKLVAHHTERLKKQIDHDEKEQIARLFTEYQPHADKLADLEKEAANLGTQLAAAAKKMDQAKIEKAIAKVQVLMEKPRAQLAKRDEAVAEVKKRAAEDCHAVDTTGKELVAMYADPAELAKHARVVEMAEVEENEFNLNIPRFVDTFEPEEPIDVKQALAELDAAEAERKAAEKQLRKLLEGVLA